MRRCSSLFRFSIESAYALISFLPFEMESVSIGDHCDLIVVHQISIALGQNISRQCQEVLLGMSVTHNVYC